MALPDISIQDMQFVEEYVNDTNQVRAALAVGLSPTYGGAAQAARLLLKNPKIQKWVKHLLKKQARAMKYRPSKILRNWMLCATTNVNYFVVDAKGNVQTAPGVPKEFIRTVRRVKQTRTERLDRDNNLVVELRTELELRDPFGPETKLMEHFKEIARDDDDEVARLVVELPAKEPAEPGVDTPTLIQEPSEPDGGHDGNDPGQF